MGLAEDLAALQELRAKGEMSESAYAAARDAAIGKHSIPEARTKGTRFGWRLLMLAIIGALVVWGVTRSRQTRQELAIAVQAPITLIDEIQNLPASSWKAVPLALPYAGQLEVDLGVVRGNPVDVLLIPIDQRDALESRDWTNLRVFTDFSATKTATYRRSSRLAQGSYYLVMRDDTLGILSSRASDITVKAQLNP